MNFKPGIYWLFSVIILVILLLVERPTRTAHNKEPLVLTSHLKIKPNIMYFNNNRFHVKVLGQTRLDINLEGIKEDITQFDALVVNQYQYQHGVTFSLNWKINGQAQHLKINQTTQSINPLYFTSQDMDQITDIHLLISSTKEVGLSNNFSHELSFGGIYLDQLKNHSILHAELSEWHDFNAVKISSINGYTNMRDLHHKSMVMKIGGWLLLSTLLFLLLKISGLHLLVTLFLGWLISGYFFVNNHIQQHQQLSESFNQKHQFINVQDQQAHELAETIAQQLTHMNKQTDDPKKLIIIGNNDFKNLRLLHHLKPFNAALDINLKSILQQPLIENVYLLFTGKLLHYCQLPKNNEWLNDQLVSLHQTNNYCLMRKK